MGQYGVSRLRVDQIVEAIRRSEGVLLRAAHELGIHRRWLYHLVYRHRLWPLVNEARIRKIQAQKAARKGRLFT